jgi:hypothetical protein
MYGYGGMGGREREKDKTFICCGCVDYSLEYKSKVLLWSLARSL